MLLGLKNEKERGVAGERQRERPSKKLEKIKGTLTKKDETHFGKDKHDLPLLLENLSWWNISEGLVYKCTWERLSLMP